MKPRHHPTKKQKRLRVRIPPEDHPPKKKLKKPPLEARKIRPVGKLTEELAAEFERLVIEGLPFSTACDYLSILPATFWKWKRAGDLYLDGGCKEKSLESYGILLLRLRKALATYLRLMNRRVNAQDPYWMQALHVLQRRDRANWSPHKSAGAADVNYDPDERFL